MLLLALTFKAVIQDTTPYVAQILAQIHSIEANIRKLDASTGFNFLATAGYENIKQEKLYIFQPGNVLREYGDFSISRFIKGLNTQFYTSIKRTYDDSTFATFNPKYETGAGLSITKKLFERDIPDEVEINRLELEAAIIELKMKLEEFIVNSAGLYASIYELEENISIINDAIDDYKKLLEVARELKKLGLKEDEDILQLESKILMLEVEVVNLNENLNELKNNFLMLTGVLIEKPAVEEIVTAYSGRSLEVLALEKKLEKQKYELSKLSSLPATLLNISYAQSGIAQELEKSFESLKSNMQFLATMKLSKPLSGYKEYERKSLELMYISGLKALENAREKNLTAIKNLTSKLESYKKINENLKNINTKYRRMILLLEKKYTNGRISLADLIRVKDELRNILKLEIELKARTFKTGIEVLKENGALLKWTGL